MRLPSAGPLADACRYLIVSLQTRGGQILSADEKTRQIGEFFELMARSMNPRHSAFLGLSDSELAGGLLYPVRTCLFLESHIYPRAFFRHFSYYHLSLVACRFSEARESLERYVTSKLYPVLFSAAEGDTARDEVITRRLRSLQFIQPRHMDVADVAENETALDVGIEVGMCLCT